MSLRICSRVSGLSPEGQASEYTMLITGGRNFNDYPFFQASLDAHIVKYGRPRLIVHGGAPGADSLASRYAYERKINLEIHGAQWGTHGSSAGPIRNKAMLDRLYQDDWVLAFPQGESRGTWNMVSLANRSDRVQIMVYRQGESDA